MLLIGSSETEEEGNQGKCDRPNRGPEVPQRTSSSWEDAGGFPFDAFLVLGMGRSFHLNLCALLSFANHEVSRFNGSHNSPWGYNEQTWVCVRLQTRTLKNTCPENHGRVLKTGGKCDDNVSKQIRVKFHATRASKILSFLRRSDIIKTDSKEEKSANKWSPLRHRKKMVTLVLWGLCGAPVQHDTVAVSATSSFQTAVKLVIQPQWAHFSPTSYRIHKDNQCKMPIFDAPVSILKPQEEAETPEKSKGSNVQEKMVSGQEACSVWPCSMAGMISLVVAPGQLQCLAASQDA